MDCIEYFDAIRPPLLQAGSCQGRNVDVCKCQGTKLSFPLESISGNSGILAFQHQERLLKFDCICFCSKGCVLSINSP